MFFVFTLSGVGFVPPKKKKKKEQKEKSRKERKKEILCGRKRKGKNLRRRTKVDHRSSEYAHAHHTHARAHT
jgi:hypothetical protein